LGKGGAKSRITHSKREWIRKKPRMRSWLLGDEAKQRRKKREPRLPGTPIKTGLALTLRGKVQTTWTFFGKFWHVTCRRGNYRKGKLECGGQASKDRVIFSGLIKGGVRESKLQKRGSKAWAGG